MSCETGEVLREDSPGSAEKEENSVKNLASMFNQPLQGPGMGRPAVAAKPKPSVSVKPGKLDLDNSIKIIGPNVRSPRFEKPSNGTAKSPSKAPPKHVSSIGKVPLGGPVLPGANTADILRLKSQLKKPPIQRPPPTSSAFDGGKVEFKRSINKKPPLAPPRGAITSTSQKGVSAADETDTDTKENVSSSKSEGDCSSLSSFNSDSSIPRRGSETSQKAVGDKRPAREPLPVLEPLPPLETIGPPPKKPAKMENIRLPRPTVPPTIAGNKSSLLGATQDPEPMDVEEDSGEFYDDVAVNAVKQQRFSLIPTMDSDEEESVEDLLYDDTDEDGRERRPIQRPETRSSAPSPVFVMPASSSLPPLPPVQSIPAIPQTSGSDDGPQEIYDDVSLDGESEELYEAVEMNAEDMQTEKRPSVVSTDSADVVTKQVASSPSVSSPSKSASTKSKQEERQRREQEKLDQQRRKKEDELRKKRDKEEKKRKEKEEKEMKKRFNFKGDVHILDTGTLIQDCGSDYEKTDLICKRGDRVEILRREGNPPGKWLARDSQGRYGFVEADFVAVESNCQETYDDVIPCDESGSEDEDQQEIYEAFD